MSPTEHGNAAPAPNLKPKAKEKEKKAKVVNKPQSDRLKTVVRRLPPNLPEDVFWQSVQKWVTDDTVQWKVYYQGKFKKRLNKENIPSRAYITFKDEEILGEFSREYDGHMFRDKAGNESIAVVEFAPYQKIPAEKKKADSRLATIEKDEDYISFLESLKDSSTKPFDAENLDTLIAAAQPPPPPTTTPLLEALKAEKSAQKDKEAIVRNHPHYKDQAGPTGHSAGKKEDAKKKGEMPAQKPAESQTSKKAAKKAAKAAHQHQQQQGQPGAPSVNAPAKAAATGAPAKQPAGSTQPKAPRPPRERQQHKLSPSNPTATAVGDPPTTASADAPAAQSDTPVQPAPARRTRPMLGLASRQFEAALSEAGVGPGERKSKREREKGRALPDEGAAAASGTTPSSSNMDTSPKRKGRAEKRPAVPNAALLPQISRAPLVTSAAPAPAPFILQRDGQQQPPKILTRPGDGQLDDSGLPQEDSGAVRGGPRPRGRGRGRGGMRGSG
ncbi:predicted protein [Sparassis crispa]|uniref:UPF3 domain-containing protein n=1 Tax=Sparassis crispa TaxID=139825 RepID=A0A401GMZ0_9APHY|nr:predicted protein [Sparassis crispa]GBE83576.1 predicted protein [Sparassis crispa]